ncbi:MAG TPA: DUF4349 domain-containing protein [Pyrinomonadaceae bacterium]|nr:DUF4349 domain-containing protein [Pyrinomonadaceae bacterium]
MRTTVILIFTLALAALIGCAGNSMNHASSNASVSTAPNSAAADHAAAPQEQARGGGQAVMQNVSLQQADQSQAAPVPVERKIIRNANLSLEVEDPKKAMQRVASVAESRGGFVVTSESRQEAGAGGGKAQEVITMEVRVPASQFDAAMNDIRGAASRITSEKISGQDVTEEYIDLDARLRTQQALESQLLDIMKGAHAVSDAISVERELANVRTEIEKIEGRKRFIENQTSLSTINVTLQPPSPLVSTTGFVHSVAGALGEGVDMAAAITLVLIRIVLALIPLAIFFGIPIYLLWRFVSRRVRRRAAYIREMQAQAADVRPAPEGFAADSSPRL